MKKLSIFLSVVIVTALCFWAFLSISLENQYTSVRKYTKPKIETTTTIKETVIPVQDTPSQVITEPIPSGVVDTTPPVIEFLNYKDGDSASLSLINILVKVTDDITSSEKIVIEGAGRQRLNDGFNPIVVTATDEAGNVGSAYIVIEKK